MVKPMHEQSPSVKLLTILNVQSAKPPSSKKRSSTTTSPLVTTRDWHAIAKKSKKVKLASPSSTTIPQPTPTREQVELEETVQEPEEDEEDEEKSDAFKHHFGSLTPLVENVEKGMLESEEEGNRVKWDKKRIIIRGLGECLEFRPHGTDEEGKGKGVEGQGLGLVSRFRKEGKEKTACSTDSRCLRSLIVQPKDVG